jgi:hypothetical protein
MDILPSGEQQRLLFDHNPYGAAHLAAVHALGRDQLGCTTSADEIDLGVTVPEDVDMRRFMVIDKDDDTETTSTDSGDHKEYIPS